MATNHSVHEFYTNQLLLVNGELRQNDSHFRSVTVNGFKVLGSLSASSNSFGRGVVGEGWIWCSGLRWEIADEGAAVDITNAQF